MDEVGFRWYLIQLLEELACVQKGVVKWQWQYVLVGGIRLNS
jgi:hypothetical protein